MKKLLIKNKSLESAKKELNQLILMKKHLQQEIQSLPPGTLYTSAWKDTWQYYKKNENGKGKIYLSKKDDLKLIHQLAQRKYDEIFLKELDQQIQTLENFIQKYKPQKLQEIFTHWPESSKLLIKNCCLENEKFIQEWQQIQTTEEPKFPERLKFTTSFGLKVRSKSEVMIAEALKNHKIPFRYEFPVKLNSYGTVHPDFFCLNPQTLTEIIWEHFGLMDEKDYATNAITKIRMYEKNGYIPGINFCTTYETSEAPLDMNQIQFVIKNYLI